MRKTWTFLLNGGETIDVQLGANPTVSHNGDLSLWTLHLTIEEKSELEKTLKDKVSQYQAVATNDKLEKETTETAKNPSTVMHCPQCFTCSWYDLTYLNKCGAMDLPHRLVMKLVSSENTVQAIHYRSCPIINKEVK